MAIVNRNWSALSFVWHLARVPAVFILVLATQTVHAGSATWSQNPVTGNWNEPSNWVPATIPNSATDMATFGASNLTSIVVSDNGGEEVSAITFTGGANSFTITISEEAGAQGFALVISGAGIINNSDVTQSFVSNSAYSGHGQFRFTGTSSAGKSVTFTNNGAAIATSDQFIAGVAFYDSSSAGSAIFVNNPALGTGLTMPGYVSFEDNATAGLAEIRNNGAGYNRLGSITTFGGNASAGQAAVVNDGATASTEQWQNGGTTLFQATSTAAHATITNNGGLANPSLGGGLGFYENSTAGSGTFVNNPGQVSGASGGAVDFAANSSAGNCTLTSSGSSLSGAFGGLVRFRDTSTAGDSMIRSTGGAVTDAIGGGIYFMDSSTAGNSTVIADGGLDGGQGGGIRFVASATGGSARVVLLGNGFLRIDAHNAPGVAIGSLEGSGNVFLGNNNLSIGSRNSSTDFSGVMQDGGSLTKVGTGTLTLSGANTYSGPTTINAGKLNVDGSIMSPVTVNNNGTLAGSGTTGSVTVNSGGVVAPSGSQTLHINGNYVQNAGGVLKIEVAGADPNASGLLDISGSATVGGTLEVRFVNGLLPISGQVIKILRVAGAFSSSFAQIIFPDLRAGFQFQPELVNDTYQITALNDGVAATGFLNISTRMRVGTGDNALIGGFIVTGTAPKKVIIRAIGPSLVSLPSHLADPTLELHDNAGGLIFSNDNWMESTQAQEIIDTGIPPSDQHEAAIVATLDPGSYTAVMRGVNNTTGVGVVEVYDLALDVPVRLANISSRGFVETGDNVMIGGFIAGNQAMHVMVRAIGPSLTQFGIINALADPTLEIHDAQGVVIAFNNDWQDADQVAIAATGIPPVDDRESAILATLAPGPYTVIVRGLNDTTGVGLVEVYNLQ
jgi:autotransporter-associated beta strand protein